MKYPELEKATKIAANLVREYFRLLTVSVRETIRRLDDAPIASLPEVEENAVAEQGHANRRSRRSIATRETNYQDPQSWNLNRYLEKSSSLPGPFSSEKEKGIGDSRIVEEAKIA
jgi:hypothetical protein